MSASTNFADLRLAEDKKAVLFDIKTSLSSVAMTDNSILSSETFGILFGCLSTTDSEQVALTCDVLNLLLKLVQPENVLDTFHDEILTGMQFQQERVKELCTNQVLRAAEVGVSTVVPHNDLVCEAVQLIAGDNLSTAQLCVKLLVCLGNTAEGLELIFQGNVFDRIQHLLNSRDVIRLRMYEVVVRISCLSPEALFACRQSGLLPHLVSELNKDDVLLQLNVLELLKDLAGCHHGIIYLEQEGVVTRLEGMMNRIDEDPLTSFLLPGLVKFFGNIAHQHPKDICGRFGVFIDLVFSLVESSDISLQVIATETLGFIGATLEGKLALEKQGDKMNRACVSMGKSLATASSELRVRLLDAVNSLLTLQVVDQTAELLSLTEQWYRRVFPRSLELTMQLASQPFLQLRCAAIQHFATLALTLWGQKTLNEYPGFNEYLLNRSTESTKEAKEEKYNVVQTLVESPTVQEVFGQPYYTKLRLYEKEGPFYVLTEAAVAFEGE